MQTDQPKTVQVLNSLIETTLDSANGYREAAENINAAEYKTKFAQRAAERSELARRLQDEVRSFGGEPEDDQSFIGKVHNKFVELKNAITGDSDSAVISEVERGEDFIKGKFEAALKNEDIPVRARDVLEQAYTSIKADHDEVSRLKHSLQ